MTAHLGQQARLPHAQTLVAILRVRGTTGYVRGGYSRGATWSPWQWGGGGRVRGRETLSGAGIRRHQSQSIQHSLHFAALRRIDTVLRKSTTTCYFSCCHTARQAVAIRGNVDTSACSAHDIVYAVSCDDLAARYPTNPMDMRRRHMRCSRLCAAVFAELRLTWPSNPSHLAHSLYAGTRQA